MSLGQTVSTVPTIGSNVERVKMDNVNFEVWDLGGQANMRPSWGMYLKGVDAVIVVIDSTDRVRIPIAKQELYQILAVPELEKVPLLILANKQVRWNTSVRAVAPHLMSLQPHEPAMPDASTPASTDSNKRIDSATVPSFVAFAALLSLPGVLWVCQGLCIGHVPRCDHPRCPGRPYRADNRSHKPRHHGVLDF